MELREIGRVVAQEEGCYIQVDKKYLKAIEGLDGFSHINVIYWFDRCDNNECREALQVKKPYKKAPDTLGVFATRSPERPNPIALSITEIIHIDHEEGRIYVTYIDAMDNTPVLDIKPYTPSIDRVKEIRVPDWCSHWPDSYEESSEFDWESEFLF